MTLSHDVSTREHSVEIFMILEIALFRPRTLNLPMIIIDIRMHVASYSIPYCQSAWMSVANHERRRVYFPATTRTTIPLVSPQLE